MTHLARLILLGICLFMAACAQSLAVSNKDTFAPQKTGVIGVFRQPVGFCSGGYSQNIILGGEKVVAKPTWTSAQDNIFSAYLKPGKADLQQYVFSCGFTQTTLTAREKHGIIIPENGFCKIVISFLKGEDRFYQQDDLLMEQFKTANVAVPFEEIPYCETY